MTSFADAKWIINYFKPTGRCLEPCAGDNAFFDLMPEPKARLEIKDGLDFFDFHEPVDWIITNPPYSVFDAFLTHSFEVAENVVLFCSLAKLFKSQKTDRIVQSYGGIKEIVQMGGGSTHGFPVGFPVGCIHYKRGYSDNLVRLSRYPLLE
jgi:hypothetical protein